MSLDIAALNTSIQDIGAALLPVANLAAEISAVFPQAAPAATALIAVEAVISAAPALEASAEILRKTVAAAVAAQLGAPAPGGV